MPTRLYAGHALFREAYRRKKSPAPGMTGVEASPYSRPYAPRRNSEPRCVALAASMHRLVAHSGGIPLAPSLRRTGNLTRVLSRLGGNDSVNT